MILLGESAGLAGHPLWHLTLIVVAPIVIIAGLRVYDRIRLSSHGRVEHVSSAMPSRSDNRLVLVAGASVAAGVIHAAVGPAHLKEGLIFGAFFLLVSAGQLAAAIQILRRPIRGLLLGAAIGNMLVVALWLYTRTIGLSFGPEVGIPEPVGLLDLVACGLEVLVAGTVLRLCFLLPSPPPTHHPPPSEADTPVPRVDARQSRGNRL